MYKTLNDAAKEQKLPSLEKGQTKIWYSKDFRSALLAVFQNKVFKAEVNETHTLLGEIASTNLNEIYGLMQGENWSPGGEARQLIQDKKLQHTSMSVGDIIQIDDVFHCVESNGFKILV